jgi:hypothetical protein
VSLAGTDDTRRKSPFASTQQLTLPKMIMSTVFVLADNNLRMRMYEGSIHSSRVPEQQCPNALIQNQA